jgi:hypothetical protein
MTTNIETIKVIPDGKPVRIFLPLKKGPERYRLQCVYQKSTPPKFNLLFKPGVLPIEDIALDQPCIINVDMGGSTISLEAMAHEIANPQTLHMMVQKSITHEQMREFFRVDATTDIISKSFHTEVFGRSDEPWSIEGKTVDISGSGILAIFPEQIPDDRQIRLQITIPSAEQEFITVLAHQVRSQKLNDGLFEVAYHFDDITTEDRDTIIGCCLEIQRQLLRLKVQVRGGGV